MKDQVVMLTWQAPSKRKKKKKMALVYVPYPIGPGTHVGPKVTDDDGWHWYSCSIEYRILPVAKPPSDKNTIS